MPNHPNVADNRSEFTEPPQGMPRGGSGDEFIAEFIQFNVVVGHWKTGKDGRRRKARQIEFNPVIRFASEDAADKNAWGDQIERAIFDAEAEARKQIENEATQKADLDEQERLRKEMRKPGGG